MTTVLIIRDGWGENPHPEHDPFNAIKLARTPVADRLDRDWPRTLVITCGEDVGLPAGTMGNSEVGHQNIGAGRIVDQEIMRIARSIGDGTFFTNPALLGAFQHARRTGGAVHLLGLVSDGKVHSDLDHLFALIDLAAKQAFPADRLLVHAISDGRDTGPTTGLGFIERLERKLNEAGVGRIASVMGRYYAMDRDHRWDRVAKAYRCLTGRPVGGALNANDSAADAVRRYYDNASESSRSGDEFIVPTPIVASNPPHVRFIEDGDAVIFFNFRGDRPRELTKAFVLDDEAWATVPHGGFDRGPRLRDLFFCTMTGYEAGLPVTAIAFTKPPRMLNILGEVISNAGLAQFRCAETEKFPHVTFFFNDYREEPLPNERRCLIPSPKDVTTYDQKPEMSAPEVCAAVLERLDAPDAEPFMLVNFANPDMVGHTGNLQAVRRAVEVVDACVGQIVDRVLARGASGGGGGGRSGGGGAIITADHGNAEQMWDPQTNAPHTAHTVHDVPLYVVGERFRGADLRSRGRLADIAPTVLEMMGLDLPREMTGRSLIARGNGSSQGARARRVEKNAMRE